VGALSFVEALGVPFYMRTSMLDVVLQAVALALGVAGVGFAVVAFRARRVGAST
jgi:hypothetical protein